jgi:hypothetical protein
MWPPVAINRTRAAEHRDQLIRGRSAPLSNNGARSHQGGRTAAGWACGGQWASTRKCGCGAHAYRSPIT